MELKKTLINIWEKQIMFTYENGVICSERHLQAYLFHYLISDKNFSKKYKIFIEPKFDDEKKELSYKTPDIVITKGSKIVCVLELKYQPGKYVSWFQHDVDKLKNIGTITTPFLFEVYPENGKRSNKENSVSNNVLIAHAMIGNYDSDAITNNRDYWKESNLKSYLQLIGSIGDPKEKKKFYSKSK